MMKLKNAVYQFCKICILAFLLHSGLTGTAAAAEETNLPFGQTVNGELTAEITSTTYLVTVPKSGRVTFDITSSVDTWTYFELLDHNNETVFRDSKNGSSLNPARYVKWTDLEPGTYKLLIHNNDEGHYGKYSIKTSFTPANNNETEPNNGTVQAQPLIFGKPITGYLSWNDSKDVYKITVPKAGRLTLDLSSYVDTWTSISLIDDENDTILEGTVDGNSKNPAWVKEWVDLEPGTYYLSVDNHNDDSIGKYIITATFIHANTTEKEPNNGITEAEHLPYHQTKTGFLSWNDSLDVYKIKVPKSGPVSFSLSSYVDNFVNIDLVDANSELVFDYSMKSSSKNPAKFSKTVNLPKGTYYLGIHNNEEDHTGKYMVGISASHLLAPLSNITADDRSAIVKGKTAPNQEVVVKASGKEYKKKANSKGEFSIGIPKQKAGAKLELWAKNEYGTKKITVTVADKTPPATPTASKVTRHSTIISGKAEAGSTVYVYKGKTKIGYAATSSNGTYKMKIKAQSKGAKLTLFTTDRAKNKSKTVYITVQ
ncbi:Ig-like domain-containing protein [Mesobacillus zeae]|nr:Ig-like domain-containing protein [Mesobacillus zeae]